MNLNRTYKRAVIALALAALPTVARSQSAKAELSVDSLLMGRVASYSVTIDTPGVARGMLEIAEDSVTSIDFVAESPLWSDDANAGRYRATYKIQAFDPGAQVIPPARYILPDGTDTIYSNAVTLNVTAVDVKPDETIDDIDTEEQFDLGHSWYDSLPDWLVNYWLWIVLGVVIIAGGVCAFLILTKRMKNPLRPQKKKVEPPYDVAMRRLDVMRLEHSWDTGTEKAYYSELTDILREYLGNRFGINALEMTTSQILAAVKHHPEVASFKPLLKDVLSSADMAKFAKVRPDVPQNLRAFNDVVTFVEQTKPAPTPEPEEEHIDGGPND